MLLIVNVHVNVNVIGRQDTWRRILLNGLPVFLKKTGQILYTHVCPIKIALLKTIVNISNIRNDFELCDCRYDATIKATGRYFTDFLHNIDNIHMQFRFTYPKMISPSMYLTHEDEKGVVLVYRSNRVGFTYYLMGK